MYRAIIKVVKRGTLVSLSILAFSVFSAIVLLAPHYRGNDDVCWRLLSSGFFSPTQTPSPYLVYINILYGRVLASVYTFWPRWHWYDLFNYALLLLASWAFLLPTRALLGRRRGLWVCGFSSFVFFTAILVQLQFTITAGLLTVSGMLLLFRYASDPNQEPWVACFYGVPILVLGSLIRFNIFFFILVYGFLAWLPVLAFLPIKPKRSLTVLLFFGVAIFLAFSAKVYNAKVYESDPTRTHIYPALKTLVSLTEHSVPVQDRREIVQAKLDVLGWSINDYLAVTRHLNTNETLFNSDTLTYLRTQVLPIISKPSNLSWLALLSAIRYVLFNTFIPVFFGFLLSISFLRKDPRNTLLVGYHFAIAAILSVALSMIFKPINFHSYVSFFPMSLGLLFLFWRFFDGDWHPKFKLISVRNFLFFILGCLLLANTIGRSVLRSQRANQFNKDIQVVDAYPKAHFMIKNFSAESWIQPFKEPTRTFSFIPFYYLTVWPEYKDLLRKYSLYPNLEQKLYDNANILFFIDTDFDVLRTYILEHYGATVRFEEVLKTKSFTLQRLIQDP